MSYVDIAVLVIIVLGALIGLLRGFFKSFIGLLATAATLVITYFLTGPITKLLIGIDFIQTFVNGPIASMAKILAFLQFDIYYLTSMVFTIFVFLIIFMVVRLLMMILTAVLKSVTRGKRVTGLLRLFGFVTGAVKGGVLVVVLLVLSITFAGALPAQYQNELHGDGSITSKYVGQYIYKQTNKFILKQQTIIFGDINGNDDDAEALIAAQDAFEEKADIVNTAADRLTGKSEWIYSGTESLRDIIVTANQDEANSVEIMIGFYSGIEAGFEQIKTGLNALPTSTVQECNAAKTLAVMIIDAGLDTLVIKFDLWVAAVENTDSSFAEIYAAFEELWTALETFVDNLDGSITFEIIG